MDGWAQDCINYIANALELLQSCVKLSHRYIFTEKQRQSIMCQNDEIARDTLFLIRARYVV